MHRAHHCSPRLYTLTSRVCPASWFDIGTNPQEQSSLKCCGEVIPVGCILMMVVMELEVICYIDDDEEEEDPV